jgi:hypothetical protein
MTDVTLDNDVKGLEQLTPPYRLNLPSDKHFGGNRVCNNKTNEPTPDVLFSYPRTRNTNGLKLEFISVVLVNVPNDSSRNGEEIDLSLNKADELVALATLPIGSTYILKGKDLTTGEIAYFTDPFARGGYPNGVYGKIIGAVPTMTEHWWEEGKPVKPFVGLIREAAPAQVAEPLREISPVQWSGGVVPDTKYVNQVHPQSFSLDGLKELIPLLKECGITSLQLMPTQPVKNFDAEKAYEEVLKVNPELAQKLVELGKNKVIGNFTWGYDPVAFIGINPNIGTIAQFQDFLEFAHKNGVEVIADFVINHGDSPLLEQVLTDSGLYSNINTPWGRSFNFNNQIVRQHFVDAAKWYVELGFDALRIDAAHHLPPDLIVEVLTECRKINSSFRLILESPSFSFSDKFTADSPEYYKARARKSLYLGEMGLSDNDFVPPQYNIFAYSSLDADGNSIVTYRTFKFIEPSPEFINPNTNKTIDGLELYQDDVPLALRLLIADRPVAYLEGFLSFTTQDHVEQLNHMSFFSYLMAELIDHDWVGNEINLDSAIRKALRLAEVPEGLRDSLHSLIQFGEGPDMVGFQDFLGNVGFEKSFQYLRAAGDLEIILGIGIARKRELAAQFSTLTPEQLEKYGFADPTDPKTALMGIPKLWLLKEEAYFDILVAQATKILTFRNELALSSADRKVNFKAVNAYNSTDQVTVGYSTYSDKENPVNTRSCVIVTNANSKELIVILDGNLLKGDPSVLIYDKGSSKISEHPTVRRDGDLIMLTIPSNSSIILGDSGMVPTLPNTDNLKVAAVNIANFMGEYYKKLSS